MLGLAQRAGKLISGEELVIKAIQEEKAKLVFWQMMQLVT
ncbi:ribosomal protein L7Ae family protein [Streptococcus sp. HSISM1]|nr:ribosomal protein L7Ae family protein [Streptococcus sp. HSISM1]